MKKVLENTLLGGGRNMKLKIQKNNGIGYKNAIVDEWWDSLPHQTKQEIIDDVYPGKIIDIDEGWYYLNLKEKIEIYRENILLRNRG